MLNTYSNLCKSNNYLMAKCEGHPRAYKGGYVYEHILVAENLRGEYLKPGEVVHHIDENPSNNNPANLDIFKDDAAHKWHHKKQRAFKACGNELWQRCPFCQKYDDPNKMYTNGLQYHHRRCHNKYKRERYKRGV